MPSSLDMPRIDMPGGEAAAEVKRQAHQAARETAPWVVALGRAGFAAKGIVYATVGVLAVQAAIGAGGATTGSKGALHSLLAAPFGYLLIGGLAIGLAGYALWRLVQAVLDTECRGDDLKGLLKRGGYLAISAAYAALAYTALRLSLGSDAEGGDTTRDWTAWLLEFPLGPWLVAIMGLAIVGTGLGQLYEAYSAKLRDKLKRGDMGQPAVPWVTLLGRIGHAARGIVLLIVGGFVLNAAWNARAEEAGGLGDALAALAQQPYGPWLLAIVGLGLIAYGAFALVSARYRRMSLR